jgi:hypothetical protein
MRNDIRINSSIVVMMKHDAHHLRVSLALLIRSRFAQKSLGMLFLWNPQPIASSITSTFRRLERHHQRTTKLYSYRSRQVLVIAASPMFVSSCVSTSREIIIKAATSSAVVSKDFITSFFAA